MQASHSLRTKRWLTTTVATLANSAGGVPSASTRNKASALSFARMAPKIIRFAAAFSHNMPTVSALTRSRTTTTFGSVRNSRGKTSTGDWPSAAL